jgi:hypothetical protein
LAILKLCLGAKKRCFVVVVVVVVLYVDNTEAWPWCEKRNV